MNSTAIHLQQAFVFLVLFLTLNACDDASSIETDRKKIFNENGDDPISYEVSSVEFSASDPFNSVPLDYDCLFPDPVEFTSVGGDFFLSIPAGSECEIDSRFSLRAALQTLQLRLDAVPIDPPSLTLNSNPDVATGARATINFGGGDASYEPDNINDFFILDFVHFVDDKRLEMDVTITVTLNGTLQQPIDGTLVLTYQ